MAGETTTRPSKSNEIYGKIKRTTQKLEISFRIFDDGPVVEIQFNWNAPCGLCSVFMVQVVMIRIVWSVCPHIQWMFVINLLFWRSALWSIFFFSFFPYYLSSLRFISHFIFFSLRVFFMASVRHFIVQQKDMQFVHFNEMRMYETHNNNRKNRWLEESRRTGECEEWGWKKYRGNGNAIGKQNGRSISLFYSCCNNILFSVLLWKLKFSVHFQEIVN